MLLIVLGVLAAADNQVLELKVPSVGCAAVLGVRKCEASHIFRKRYFLFIFIIFIYITRVTVMLCINEVAFIDKTLGKFIEYILFTIQGIVLHRK